MEVRKAVLPSSFLVVGPGYAHRTTSAQCLHERRDYAFIGLFGSRVTRNNGTKLHSFQSQRWQPRDKAQFLLVNCGSYLTIVQDHWPMRSHEEGSEVMQVRDLPCSANHLPRHHPVTGHLGTWKITSLLLKLGNEFRQCPISFGGRNLLLNPVQYTAVLLCSENGNLVGYLTCESHQLDRQPSLPHIRRPG